MIRNFHAVMLLLATPLVACCQHPPEVTIGLEGSEVFRAILGRQGLTAIEPSPSIPQLRELVLVIFGSPPGDSHADLYTDLSRRIISRGGAVLIATDNATDLTEYFPFGTPSIRIDGRIVTDRGVGASFNDIPDLPFLRFEPQQVVPDADLISISRLTRVATNRSSTMIRSRNAFPLYKFAGFSRTAGFDGDGGILGPAMMIAPPDQGTAIVLADAGVLANQWLLATPSRNGGEVDNLKFAMHLASYLVNSPAGNRPRKRLIFWDTSRPVINLDAVQLNAPFPEVQPSWPVIQQTLASKLNQKIDERQQTDFPTRNVLRLIGHRRSIRWLLAISLILLAGWLFWKLRWSQAMSNTGDGRKFAAQSPDRFEAMEAAGNYYLLARESSLQWLTERGLATPDPPKLDIPGDRLYRKRMNQELKVIWRVALGSPRTISAARWVELQSMRKRVDEALQLLPGRTASVERTS